MATDIEGALRKIRAAGFDETDPDSIRIAADWMAEHGFSEEDVAGVVDKAEEIAGHVEEHGPAFRAWIDNQGVAYADPERFQESYRGEYPSLAEYVQEYWDDTSELRAPDGQWWHPLNYVDWGRMAEELETSGDIFTMPAANGGVYVFDNNV